MADLAAAPAEKSSAPAGTSTATDIQGVMDVTEEDQNKINLFARLNARHEDIKEEVTKLENTLKNHEDALAEAEVKVLEDEDDDLHLLVGDILVNLEADKTQKWLEEKMEGMKKTLSALDSKKVSIMEEMSQLKAELYARFGNNIHLESGP